MKNFILFLILAFAVSAEYHGYINNEKKIFNDKSIIGKVEWNPIAIANDSTILKVSWQEKYGPEKTVECLIVWESEKQFKLTSKNLNVIIEKTNTNDLKIERIKNEFRN